MCIINKRFGSRLIILQVHTRMMIMMTTIHTPTNERRTRRERSCTLFGTDWLQSLVLMVLIYELCLAARVQLDTFSSAW